MALGKKTGGRVAGTPNKTTVALKEAILAAAEAAGGDEGATGYLTWLARENSSAFGSLLGKVLPTQITGKDDGPIELAVHSDADRAAALLAFMAKTKTT